MARKGREDAARTPPKVERVALDDLSEDTANARKHGEANLAAITASLRRFGQTRALVVQAGTGRIMAGNGTFAAMRALGWTHCDVVRLPFDNLTATAYGIADNRTAELAGWDEGVLGALLREVQAADFPVSDLGFTDEEVASIGLPDAAPVTSSSVTGQDAVGAKEYGEDGFQGFAHACPRCGFEFDRPAQVEVGGGDG